MSRSFTIPLERQPVYGGEARLFARELGTFASGNPHPFALGFQIQYETSLADRRTGRDTTVWWRHPEEDVIQNTCVQRASTDMKRAIGAAAFGIAYCPRVAATAHAAVAKIGFDDMGGVLYDILCFCGGVLILAEHPAEIMQDIVAKRGMRDLDQRSVDITMRALVDTGGSAHDELAFTADIEACVARMVRQSVDSMWQRRDVDIFSEDDAWRARRAP